MSGRRKIEKLMSRGLSVPRHLGHKLVGEIASKTCRKTAR